MVHQNVSHELRRNRKKVRTALPADVAPVNETQPRLIDQSCRLQRVFCSFAGHIPTRQTVQFCFDQSGQVLQCSTVTLLPSSKELRNVT